MKVQGGGDQFDASFLRAEKGHQKDNDKEEEGASFLQGGSGKKVIKCFGCDKENTYLNSCKNPPFIKIW